MTIETELKLKLDAAALPSLRDSPALRRLQRDATEPRRIRLVYYDTPDFALLAAHLTLRVRLTGGHFVQEATAVESADGPARREWKWPIDGDRPEYGPLRKENGLTALQNRKLFDSLMPVFTSEIERTSVSLGHHDWGARLALDHGRVVAGNASATIVEAELALTSGRPRHLFDAALSLVADLPLRVSSVSKSQLGYGLLGRWEARPRKAEPIRLPRGVAAGEAFRIIAGDCYRQFVVNLDCFSVSGDLEAVHQMRVGLRRLRSAMQIFADLIHRAETATLRPELSWLQDCLAAVRDADVFLDQIVGPVGAAVGRDRGYAAVTDHFMAVRDGAAKALRQAASSPRFTRLVLALGRFCAGGDWLDDAGPERRLLLAGLAADRLSGALGKRDRRLRKVMKRLRELTPAERHKVRIRLKRLRYGIEFFAGLGDAKTAAD